MKTLDRAVLLTLLLIHVGLVIWAVGGLAEYVVKTPLWPSLRNQLFSPAMQAVHWIAIALGGATFLLGFTLRWRNWALAVAAAYAVMAATCAVETFEFLEHDGRYADMAAEYVTYSAILLYLSRSPLVRRWLTFDAGPAR